MGYFKWDNEAPRLQGNISNLFYEKMQNENGFNTKLMRKYVLE